jgi:hypothetical protein
MPRIFNSIRQRLLAENRFTRYLVYAIGEIILVVVGILIALQLNTRKEDRKSAVMERNILVEIRNGLDKDLVDIEHNKNGHRNGIRSCTFWSKVINGLAVDDDSVAFYYWYLTRSYTLAQNTASYESLKSRGLDLIANDALRLHITTLYEVEYVPMKMLEENYQETQFHANYFNAINRVLAPALVFDPQGELVSLRTPLIVAEGVAGEMRGYLWRIARNRQHVLNSYRLLEEQIALLRAHIEEELARIS